MKSEESTIAELLRDAAARLASAGVPEARREAGSLLSFALGRDRTFLIAHPGYSPEAAESERYAILVERRAAREPLSYIIGNREFYGLEFAVNPDVLIPRPETELIVAEAAAFLEGRAYARFCEVGVGSGCIAVSILKSVPYARAIALDVSENALAIARRNAAAHAVADRLELRRSDVFDGLSPDERFDAIVSNPPYVAADDFDGLQPEVRDHEPRSALTDGADGLSIIRRLIGGSARHLDPGGLLLIEIGFGQSRAVTSMIDPADWSEPSFLLDLQRIERTLRVIRR